MQLINIIQIIINRIVFKANLVTRNHCFQSYTGDLLVMKDKQLGSTKYIRLGVIKLPAGIFLGMTGQAAAAVSVS